MAILNREKLATFGVEVVVVVFGILIAFQVEEWREDRQRGRELDAALIRLNEETEANLRACDRIVPILAHHARSAVAVVRALNDGHLGDANRESFDAGLIRVGYVTGVPYSETVAEEMIATGLLKELKNAELRSHIATLPARLDGARHWDIDPLGSLGAAVAEVANTVEFKYHGDLPEPKNIDAPDRSYEEGISVEYVFDELVANRTLKNVFIEAADTHLDMWRNHQDVCRKFREIQSSLAAMSPR
jgi:hypothetical protein